MLIRAIIRYYSSSQETKMACSSLWKVGKSESRKARYRGLCIVPIHFDSLFGERGNIFEHERALVGFRDLTTPHVVGIWQFSLTAISTQTALCWLKKQFVREFQ